MRRLGVTVLTSTLLLALLWAVPAAVVAGNLDAAHACQQSGYVSLQGTDGTQFKNAGECVSHVARGGQITGVQASCSYTPGVSGCINFDDVVVPLGLTGTGPSSTTLAGMFTFAPVDSWAIGTTVSVSGSGTWVTSTGSSGTWTATDRSSIYPTTFFDFDGSTGTATPAPCGAANTRNVGVHFDVFQGGAAAGAIEIGIRDATWGTNFVQYQGFTSSGSGEPWGIHTTTNMTGVTLRC